MKCPSCGNQVQEDAVFCDQCGTRLPRPAAATAPATTQQPATQQEQPAEQADMLAQEGRCSNCGTVNTPGEMFCGECGAPLAAPQPEPAAAVQAPAVPVAPSPSGTSRTCPDCGATVAEGEEFCYACGAELKTVGAPAPAVETAASAQPTEATPPAEQPAPASEAAAPTAEAPAPAAPAARECPACGAQVNPGDSFCEFCGAALAATPKAAAPAQPTEAAPVAASPAPAAPQPTAPVVAQPPVQAAPAGPRLVVSSGIEIPLAANKETIVGREDPYSGVFPDVDLTPHGGEEAGVSRRHFKITVSGGQYMIEDLNSTNYTLLNRNRLQPGMPSPLNDGDEIRAGRLKLVFKVR